MLHAFKCRWKKIKNKLHLNVAVVISLTSPFEKPLILYFKGMLSLVEDDKLNLEEKLDEIEKTKMSSARDLHHLREDLKDKDLELEELRIKVKFLLLSCVT